MAIGFLILLFLDDIPFTKMLFCLVFATQVAQMTTVLIPISFAKSLHNFETVNYRFNNFANILVP